MKAGVVVAVCFLALWGCCNCLEGLPETESEPAAVELTETFSDESMGFSLGYPSHWGVDKQDANFLLVSGQDDGRDDLNATVNIQKLLHREDATVDQKVQAEVDSLRSQFLQMEGKVHDEEDYTFVDVSGAQRQGTRMVVEYTLSGIRFKQMQLVIPGKDENIVWTWAYTNHEEHYDEHLPVAEAMLGSWRLTK